MSNKTDFFCALALLVSCVLFGHQIWQLPPSASNTPITPATFPAWVIGIMAVLSAILLFKSLFGVKGAGDWPERRVLLPVLMMGLLILAYIGGFILLGHYAMQNDLPVGSGFVVTSWLFLIASQCLAGHRHPVRTPVIATGMVAGMYGVFAHIFNVSLP